LKTLLEQCHPKVGDTVSIFVNKERHVREGGSETWKSKIHSEVLVPSTWILLKPVQGTLQQTYMITSSRIVGVKRLLTVLHMTMQKIIFHV